MPPFYMWYFLTIAEKIEERTPARLVLLNGAAGTISPEDPYAEFPVPDDLMW